MSTVSSQSPATVSSLENARLEVKHKKSIFHLSEDDEHRVNEVVVLLASYLEHSPEDVARTYRDASARADQLLPRLLEVVRQAEATCVFICRMYGADPGKVENVWGMRVVTVRLALGEMGFPVYTRTRKSQRGLSSIHPKRAGEVELRREVLVRQAGQA